MPDSCNRRDFLKRASLLSVAAVSGASLASAVPAAAAVEPIKRVGGPLLKVSCNAYSFAHLLGKSGKMDLLQLADTCAKMNFDAFDPTGYYFPGYEKNGPGVPTDKFIFQLKRRAFGHQNGISSHGV